MRSIGTILGVLVIILALLILLCCVPAARESTIKSDPICSGWILYDEKGTYNGYLKRDIIIPGQVNIYDKKGEMQGYWKKDVLSP